MRRERRSGNAGEAESPSELPANSAGVVTRAVAAECKGEVLGALEQLEPLDRQIVVLRGIEQSANQTVAALLGMAPDTVSHRYRRALVKLRTLLRDSAFAELPEN